MFLYKRAQIFCGDVYGALGRAWAPAAFTDIGAITMFADYRVPVVLQGMGIMRLSPELADKVRQRHLLAALFMLALLLVVFLVLV